ncbi:uncharacterized protein LOC106466087 isoform X2 [Limulus polyphemus]|uniref:Uncharacterized protein LOC106466087 isoform X2 n=1 Tax=Limulus polyphemus TaxID=6850 RepID=A0ABM1BGY0_LIMPO|nr:uncharacterized protein LOC106466087 isoform X2 [Limulus polyphemus]
MYGFSKGLVFIDVYNDIDARRKELCETKKPRLTENRGYHVRTAAMEGLQEGFISCTYRNNLGQLPSVLDRDEFVSIHTVEDRLPPVPEGEEDEEEGPAMTSTITNHKKQLVSPKESFMTMLELNHNDNSENNSIEEKLVEEVIIYRLPGERLGMALKFEGGVDVKDNVSQIFIQSINADSPAARARCLIKPLQEGDEILKIDGHNVCEITRLDCVSLLRDASLCIKMLIRHENINGNNHLTSGHTQSLETLTDVVNNDDKPPLPSKKMVLTPPLPPRKSSNLIKNATCRQQEEPEQSVIDRIAIIEQNNKLPDFPIKRPSKPPPLPPRIPKPLRTSNTIDSLPEKQLPRDEKLSMKLPHWEVLMQRRVARLEDTLHQDESEATVYIDTFVKKDTQTTESEPSDTGSSVSRMIERSCTDNSNLNSQTTLAQSFDLKQVLSPFEQLEREFNDSEEKLSDTISHSGISDDLNMVFSTQTIDSTVFAIEPPESFQDYSPEATVENCSFPAVHADDKEGNKFDSPFYIMKDTFFCVEPGVAQEEDYQGDVTANVALSHIEMKKMNETTGERSNLQIHRIQEHENGTNLQEVNIYNQFISARTPTEEKVILEESVKNSNTEQRIVSEQTIIIQDSKKLATLPQYPESSSHQQETQHSPVVNESLSFASQPIKNVSENWNEDASSTNTINFNYCSADGDRNSLSCVAPAKTVKLNENNITFLSAEEYSKFEVNRPNRTDSKTVERIKATEVTISDDNRGSLVQQQQHQNGADDNIIRCKSEAETKENRLVNEPVVCFEPKISATHSSPKDQMCGINWYKKKHEHFLSFENKDKSLKRDEECPLPNRKVVLATGNRKHVSECLTFAAANEPLASNNQVELTNHFSESSSIDQNSFTLTSQQDDRLLLTFAFHSEKEENRSGQELSLDSRVKTKENHEIKGHLIHNDKQENESTTGCRPDFRNLDVCQDVEDLSENKPPIDSGQTLDCTNTTTHEIVELSHELPDFANSELLETGTDIKETSFVENVTAQDSGNSSLSTDSTGVAVQSADILDQTPTDEDPAERVDDNVNDYVEMELVTSRNNQSINGSPSLLLELSRQPPDGHEFPSKCSEPRHSLNRRSSSFDEDSGVFVNEQSSQGSDRASHSDLFHSTNSGQKTKRPPTLQLASKQDLEKTIDNTNMKQKDLSYKIKNCNNTKILPLPPSKLLYSPRLASSTETNKPWFFPSEDSLCFKTSEKSPEFSCDKSKEYLNFRSKETPQNSKNDSHERRNFTEQATCKSKNTEDEQKKDKNLIFSSRSCHGRFKEKPVSVKDRIAMFSGSELDVNEVSSDTTKKTVLCFEDKELIASPHEYRHLSGTPAACSSVKNQESSGKVHGVNNICVSSENDSLKKNHIFDKESFPKSQSLESNFYSNRPTFQTHNYNKNITSNIKPSGNKYPNGQDLTSSSYRHNFGARSLIYNRFGISSSRSHEDLSNRSNNWNLFSLQQKSSKSNSTKFKGLVIPEKPLSALPAVKSLPTIASKTTCATSKLEPVKSLTCHQWKEQNFSQPEKTKSLPRKLGLQSSLISKDTVDRTNKQPLLSDPPWKNANPNVPKYSPAFQRRSLQLPRTNVTSSVSPTPPSSLTSPMSPPPSSPSSISSSNTSSSFGITSPPTVKKQSVFQFSLSHSKPVTPLLPEKPVVPSAFTSSDSEEKDCEQSTVLSPPLYEEETTNSFSSSKLLKTSFSTNSLSDIELLDSKNSFTCSTEQPIHKNNHSSSWQKDYKQSSLRAIKSCESNSSQESTHDERFKNKPETFGTADIPYRRTNSSINFTEYSKELNSDIHGKFLAKPVCIDFEESETLKLEQLPEWKKHERPLLHKYDNVSSFPPTVSYRQPFDRAENNSHSVLLDSQYPSEKIESDDNYFSMVSQRTEDSRQAASDLISESNSDSPDHPATSNFKARQFSQQKTVLHMSKEAPSEGAKNFRALAEQWERKSFDGSQELSSPPALPLSSPPTSKCNSLTNLSQSGSVKLPPSLMPKGNDVAHHSRRNGVSNQSLANNVTSGVKMRDKQQSVPRPTSLIEEMGKKNINNVWNKGFVTNSSFPSKEKPGEISQIVGKPLASREAFSRSRESLDQLGTRSRPYLSSSARSMSVSDIRKSFENNTSNPDAFLLSNFKPRIFKSSDIQSNYDVHSESRQISDDCSNLTLQSEKCPPFEGFNSTLGSDICQLSGDCSSSSIHFASQRPSNNLSNTPVLSNHTQVSDHTNSTVKSNTNGINDDQFSSFKYVNHQAIVDQTHSDFQSGIHCSSNDINSKHDTKIDSCSTRVQTSTKNHPISCADEDKSSVEVKRLNKKTSDYNNLFSAPTTDPKRTFINENTSKYNRRNSNNQNSIPASDQNSENPLALGFEYKHSSSVDSSASESRENSPMQYQSKTSSELCGLKPSLSSLTGTISPQERQQLLEEANQILQEEGIDSKQDISVVVIQRELQAGSIGISLAGGADYEVKEITVHKIVAGSLADRNRQVRKGDRILSLNGLNVKGLTHREVLDILKAPRNEVVLVLASERSTPSNFSHQEKANVAPELTNGYHATTGASEKEIIKIESPIAVPTEEKIITVELEKDKTGIGFSLEGGKDSPLGNRPLTIKKIFKGGSADKVGQLRAGDQILTLNNQPVSNMTRTEAWSFMKKLPDGTVAVTVKQCS